MEQECLEEYIKLSQNTKNPTNVRSKEQSLITTIEKKKECEDRAIAVVELLLEGSVRPETFLKSMMYLNSTYYQDMVEERAITKVCGYPLCGNKIRTILNKRYSISTKNNKVYDLNEYGYFCSIFCFNASNHVKNQIDDSPLWLRDLEQTPIFSLLRKNEGHLSAGINLNEKISVNEGDFIPVASFAEISLKDFIQFEDMMNNKSKKFTLETEELFESNGQHWKATKQKLETVKEDDKDEVQNFQVFDKKQNEKPKENINGLENLQYLNIDLDKTRIPIEQEKKYITEAKFVESRDPVKTQGDERCRKYNTDENLEKSKQNFTMTTNFEKLYVVPKNKDIPNKLSRLKDINDKIKNKFNKPNVKIIDPLPLKIENSEVEKSIKKNLHEKLGPKNASLLKLQFSHKNPSEIENQINNSVRKWISLDTLIFVHGEKRIREILHEKKLTEFFEKLKIAQLEVSQQQKYIDICKRLHFQEILEQKKDSEFTTLTNLQALPDYKDLKKEKQVADIKIKHFLGGMLYKADDRNFPMKETKEKEGEGVPAVLPLVDVNSQNVLRRRVLLGGLNKSVKFFLDIVKYHSVSLFSDLQDLVKTFKLSADNVVFKPIVLNYLGFVCLKILALKDADLQHLMTTTEAIEYESLILNLLPGKNRVVHSCLISIENVDWFIENYFVSDM